jgi:vancomycin permeability regulator SanA
LQLVEWSSNPINDGFTAASTNLLTVAGNTYQPSGYKNVMLSPDYVALNSLGDNARLVRSGRFDAIHLYAAGAWRNNLRVTFRGFRTGEGVVYTKIVFGSHTSKTVSTWQLQLA